MLHRVHRRGRRGSAVPPAAAFPEGESRRVVDSALARPPVRRKRSRCKGQKRKFGERQEAKLVLEGGGFQGYLQGIPTMATSSRGVATCVAGGDGRCVAI